MALMIRFRFRSALRTATRPGNALRGCGMSRVVITAVIGAVLCLPTSLFLKADDGTGKTNPVAVNPLADKALLKRLTRGSMRRFVFLEEPRPVGDLTFADAHGRAKSLEAFPHKLLVLNFWALQCRACRKDLPALDRLARRLAIRQNNIAVIPINIDNADTDRLRLYYAKYGIEQIPAYRDSHNLSEKRFGVIGTPTTILLDCKGRELGRTQGAMRWDSDNALLLLTAMSLKTVC